jgi:hypothetical protein
MTINRHIGGEAKGLKAPGSAGGGLIQQSNNSKDGASTVKMPDIKQQQANGINGFLSQ